VPGLGAGGDVDEILVHYDSEEVSDAAQLRIEDWKRSTGLSLPDLQRFGGLGFRQLTKLKETILDLPDEERRKIAWGGLPKWEQLCASLSVIWQTFNLSRSGAHTARQLSFLTWRLYRSRTLTAFLRSQFDGERPMAPDDLFAFLRTSEFSLPEMLTCLDASVRQNLGLTPDYSVFAARLENWFRSESVKSLEEVGFPIVLFERMNIRLAANATVGDALRAAAAAVRTLQTVTPIELEMVRDAVD
jgi:hypothetical protein